MDNFLVNTIKSTEIFSSLTEEECLSISHFFETIQLKCGTILFNQNDSSDCLYILVDGNLSAILKMTDGTSKIVGTIKKGETVGELGVLSQQPRTLTVKATIGSTLLKLPANSLAQICQIHPAVLYKIIGPIVSRSQRTIQLLAQNNKTKHIVVIPTNDSVSLSSLKAKIKKNISNFVNITLLVDSEFEIGVEEKKISNVLECIEKIEKENSTILYLIESYDSALLKVCIEKADDIYFVSDSNSNPNYSEFVRQLLSNRKQLNDVRDILVLQHNDSKILPGSTESWLIYHRFSLYHHVRTHNDNDYQRLLRFMLGKTTGLVLGGGGMKGWAHLGVIKALEEANIPIDMTGGTSIGSIVAGCFSLSETYEATLEKFRFIMNADPKLFKLKNFTWPSISILSSKNNTEALIKAFDNLHIEDLWLPYFCLSCNLTLKNESIHTQGLLWEKIRASVAVPGIVPPMVLDGQLHVDGGLVNNLPVDVMRNFLGTSSKIVAVRVSSQREENHSYNFPPVLTFKQALLVKLGWKHHEYKFPSFLDTFINALLVGSYQKELQCSMQADLLISPNLSSYKMLKISKNQEDNLIDLGYHSTVDLLSKSKSKF